MKEKSRTQKVLLSAAVIAILMLLTVGSCSVLTQDDVNTAGRQYICVDADTGILYSSSDQDCSGTDSSLMTSELQGEAGEPGEPGDPGDPGLIGLQGPAGRPGDDGLRGLPGAAGEDGVDGEDGEDGVTTTILGAYEDISDLLSEYPVGLPGDSYIVGSDLYVWNVTNNEWSNVGRIQGPEGIQGLQGVEGLQGLQGLQGEQGIQGLPGVMGPTGPAGATGPSGPAGEPGADGAIGPMGPMGATGPAGANGQDGVDGQDGADGTSISILGSYATMDDLLAAHPTGQTGDGYLVDGYLYVWDAGNAQWLNVGLIRGPQGEKGDKGDVGDTGATGAMGPIGLTGIEGAIGPQGLPGPIGPQGLQGDQGLQGLQGLQGPQGIQGPQGAVGPQGPAGTSGFGSFGSFYDNVTQINPNPAEVNKMMYRNADDTSGVSIVNDTRITFANAGTYNIAFSVQFQKTDGSSTDISIWLSKGLVDMPWTATDVTIQGNTQRDVAAWNFFVTVDANEYVELNWSSADDSVRLLAVPPRVATDTHPEMPGIPSVILTVNQVQ